MRYVELLRVIDQLTVIALDPLAQHDVARNLQDTHYLAFVMREPHSQKRHDV